MTNFSLWQLFFYFWFCFTPISCFQESFLSKLPIYDNIELNNFGDENFDPFIIYINNNKLLDTWLNDTNYISTFHSILYLYNSKNNDPVDNITITELGHFSKFMLDSSYNTVNKHCIPDQDDDFEFASFKNIEKYDELNSNLVDDILSCQEDVKVLTFIIDMNNLNTDHDMLEEVNQRIVIFPPSMIQSSYNKNKKALTSFETYTDNFFEEEQNDDEEESDNIDNHARFKLFINKSKFTIFNNEYHEEEIVFFEYENLSLRHMTENFSDWKFQLWDFLAKVLMIYINIPQTIKDQTNQFVYYFTIFFLALIVTKKKIIPFFSKGDNSSTTMKIFCMFLSFLIILTSITGYQFVKSNAIILLAKEEVTEDLVYFAGSFNWQFGIETIIISVIYVVLGIMVVSLIKKSKEEVSDNEQISNHIAFAKLLTTFVLLYTINYLSQTVLTQGIFRNIKYNGDYAY